MPITVETYISPNFTTVNNGDMPGVRSDNAVVASAYNSGCATAQSEFLPATAWKEPLRYDGLIAEARKNFGPAAEEFMTSNEGLAEALGRGSLPDNVVVLGGFCALPKMVNSELEPRGKPGSATLEVVDSSGQAQKLVLPQDLGESVQLLTNNPPPITLPGLVSAAAPTARRTILLAEVGFYTDWTLDKLVRNLRQQPSRAEIEEAQQALQGFFEQTYQRAVSAWDQMRRTVMRGVEVGAVTQISDLAIKDSFEASLRDLGAKVGYEVADGPVDSAVKAAAFYGPPIVTALRDAGLMKPDELAVIAEAQVNVVIPKDDLPFNQARRQYFSRVAARVGFWGDRDWEGAQNLSTKRPALVSYAPMTNDPLCGTPYDRLSPYAVPNERNYGTFVDEVLAGGTSTVVNLRQNQLYMLGTSMPQGPEITAALGNLDRLATRPLRDYPGDGRGSQKQARREQMGEAADKLAAAIRLGLSSIFGQGDRDA